MLKNKSTKNKTSKESLKKPEVFIMTQSNTEELKAARSATTGEQFDSLDERIDCEVDRLNKKIEVSMLQQESAESHVVENTVDGITTDMVVKGRTLQNIFPSDATKLSISSGSISDGLITINAQNNTYGNMWDVRNPLYKTNTKYSVIIDILENTLVKGETTSPNQDYLFIGKSETQNDSVFSGARTLIIGDGSKGRYIVPLETISDFGTMTNNYGARIFLSNAFTGGQLKLKIMILEGDWTNKPIPQYFEGIKSFGQEENKISILSHGKNFFKSYKSKTKGNTSIFNIENDNVTIGTNQSPSWTNASINYGKLKIGSKYTVSCESFTGGVGDKVLFAVKKYRGREEVGAYGDITKNSLGLTFTVVDDADIVLRFFVNNTTPINTPTSITYNNIQIVEGGKTDYTPSIIDKKDILLGQYGFDEGLRGLNLTVYDELNDIKNVAIKRVDKKIITSELPITLQSINEHGIANFHIPINNLYGDKVGFCNKLILQLTLIADTTTEGFSLSMGAGGTYIRIKSEKASNVEEFKQYLATLDEPIVIYYPCEPIETPLSESIALKVYNEKTYVSFENFLKGTSSFKAPVDTVATIARLNKENRALEEENKNLRQDFESTTLVLTDSDLKLVKQNVDMDFRLMEVEFALDIPQAILSSDIKFKKKKGEVKSMARTPYEMMKIVILSGDYDREDYMHKVGKYYERGRMTKEEHDELMSLMTADEVISK